MDNFLFKLASRIRDDHYYQKYTEWLSSLDESHQNKINKAIGILFLLIPLSIAIFLLLSSISLKNDLSTKRQIVQQVNEIQSRKSNLDTLKKKMMISTKTKTLDDMNNRIKFLLEPLEINSSYIKIMNFKRTSPMQGFFQNSFDITFNNLTMEHLSGFLTTLLVNNKSGIPSIKVERKKENNTLSGTIKVIQYEK